MNNIRSVYTRFGLLLPVLMLLFAVDSSAQKTPGESAYKIPPAITGAGSRVLLGLQNGTIIRVDVNAGSFTYVDTASAGKGLPAGVTGIWDLSMPDRVNSPTTVVGLASFNDGSTTHYGIVKSSDMGNTWRLIQPAALMDPALTVTNDYWLQSLSRLYWLDSQTGWLYGNRGLFKTSDGGETWALMAVGTIPQGDDQFRTVAFRDAQNGVAARGWYPKERFEATTDGGATWSVQSSPIGLLRVNQIDWIGGEYRALVYDRSALANASKITTYMYYSRDLGSSWTARPIGAIVAEQGYMTEILWAGLNSGFMTIRSGELWATSDSGKTWKNIQNADSTNFPMKIGSNVGYGFRSVLLDGNRIVQVSTTSSTGEIYRLMQWSVSVASAPSFDPSIPSSSVEAFPNPAADELLIRFRTSGGSNVRIAITDMLGRTVQTRELGRVEAGEQQTRIALQGLPVGTYRCVVASGAGAGSVMFVKGE